MSHNSIHSFLPLWLLGLTKVPPHLRQLNFPDCLTLPQRIQGTRIKEMLDPFSEYGTESN